MVSLRSLLLSIATVAPEVVSSISQVRSDYVLKETHHIPRGWRRGDRAPEHYLLDLNIGVKQANFSELERHLYEVSHPSHHRYGQHLTADEVNELVRPTDEALNLIEEWLLHHGIQEFSHSPARDWIHVSLPIDKAERLLNTEYYSYTHEDGTHLIRTPQWSLPSHLHSHIDTIQPTTSFFRTNPLRVQYVELMPWVSEDFTTSTDDNISKFCDINSVTPQCFMHLYGTEGYVPKALDNNSIAFNNFLGEVPIRPDTEMFLTKYRSDAVSGASLFPQISIANGPAQDGPLTAVQIKNQTSKEANLDIQTLLGIAWPINITSYSTGGSPTYIPDLRTPNNTNEPYLDWLNFMLNQTSLPRVISTSYGDDEQTVPKSYAIRVCNSLAQLGARGVSLLFASGDAGVGTNGTCISNDGKNTTMFVPSFPASCPYVTAVGATHQFKPEVAAFRPGEVDKNGVFQQLYASGGGFSNYFTRPSYQNAVVQDYITALQGKYDGLYNKSGRAYPDIAAQGQNFAFVWNGTFGAISGTSAATPLMSGIIALINDVLLSTGQPTLGFLNPWIYAQGFQGFTDVTNGSAAGCQVDGFPATEGWDPVTGFGTPNFPVLRQMVTGSASRSRKIPKIFSLLARFGRQTVFGSR
ncbi:peptidase S8/S53 domain-containing protein [Xylogone sp. PMI_703]|nr:peptidase S8/S53 domain-containing protein [Xylogone sp. PMI_703]